MKVLHKDYILTAERMGSINFTENDRKFCLSFYCNGANSYLFANGTEIIKFKVKDSEIVATSLSLVNTSKNFSIDNLKKSRIKWISLIMMLLQLMIY